MDEIVYTGVTDLINAITDLQGVIDTGLFTIGVSSLDVIGVLSSPGLQEILKVKQQLSSMLATSVTDSALFTQILAVNGYSTIEEYNTDYSNLVKSIADQKSTVKGLKDINDLSGTLLPIAVYNVTTKQIIFDADSRQYQTDLETQSTISSYYISTLDAYSKAIQEYIAASTLEYTSTSTLMPQYADVMSAYWSSIVDTFGTKWINENGVQQRGTLEDVISAYSSLQISDNILHDLTAIPYFSSLVEANNNNISSYQGQLSSSISVDYSTLVSTYTKDIMKYKDEIMSVTFGDIHIRASTMIGYSTLWLSALQADSNISSATRAAWSTYHYYDDLMNQLSANIGQWSSIYTSSLTSLQAKEAACCTIHQIVDFLELELAEVNALSKFDSANTLKDQLEDMIRLIGQGVNIDANFDSIQGTLQGLQSGGASLQDVQLMYSTVGILYYTYSTIAISTTASRAAANLPPSIDDIAANELSTVISVADVYIASAQAAYDLDSVAWAVSSSQLSSQMSYMSTYIATSTISESTISSIYDAEYGAYSSMIQTLLMEEYSTQQAIYRYTAAGQVSSILIDNAYNTIEQIILRLEELGYIIGGAQSGGGIEELIKTETAKLLSISSMTISMGQSGEIGAANLAVCTTVIAYNGIQNSIDAIQNAATNINTDTFTTTADATRNLYNDAAILLQYSDDTYSYYLQASNYRYTNYLTTLTTLSSLLTLNLLENRDEITQLNYISAFKESAPGAEYIVVNPSTPASLSDRVNELSTKSGNIRNYRPMLQDFINVILAEEFSNDYYLMCKSTFEHQEYYRIKQVNQPADMMSNYDYDQLTTAYDISIQNVNRYIGYRTGMYKQFIAATDSLKSSIRPDVLYDLEFNINPVFPLTIYPVYSIVSSLKMDFQTIPPRMLFPESGIPTTTLMNCPTNVGSDPSAVTRIPYPAEPTTTIDTKTYGIKGRYVRISKSDGNFEILQVCVIDSTGKNVAFGKAVTSSNGVAATSIVNGQYSPNVPVTFTPYFKMVAAPTVAGTTLLIDLGALYDITCIRYVKSSASPYNSVGLAFDILDETQSRLAGGSMRANTATEDIDFRPAGSRAIKDIVATRTGACGYMGRYIRVLRPSGAFQISQIVAVSLNGVNVAAGSSATYTSTKGGSRATPIITDRSYYSRPTSSCFVQTVQDPTDYIEIDFGSEKEIVAVHIHGVSDVPNQYIVNTIIRLYTEDRLQAYQQVAVTNNKKEIIDFRVMDPNAVINFLLKNNGAVYTPLLCSTDLAWPAYYGEAGIICRYVGLTKTGGKLGFTKIKVIDKAGKDVALFKKVTVNSEAIPDSRYYGVSDYASSQPSSMSYYSAGVSNQSYIIDLEKLYEVCAVTVFRCSDGAALTDGTTLQFFSDDPTTTAPFAEIPVTGAQPFYDLRYDPDDAGSKYPTDIATSVYTYGKFGTLALTVDIPIYTSTMRITEGTGQDLYPSAIIIPNDPSYVVTTQTGTISYTSSLTEVKFENLREVNSVIVESAPIGTRITLRDCEGYIVNNKPIQAYSTSTGVHRLADFRNPNMVGTYAPLLPLSFSTFATASSAVHNIYTNTATPEGIVARYVKVTPPSGFSLFISQLIVVDSRGINVAFQKDTFTSDTTPIAIQSTGNAVDGQYEQNLDTNPSLLSYENYVCRSSPIFTAAADKYWVVDLGEEYLVNSVVYVAALTHGNDSKAAIVELFNAQLNCVAVQPVSQYVSIFGVDILDFRVNRSAPAVHDGCYLEVRPRRVLAGCTGCGMMAQYVRIEGHNIKLSQIIAIDPTGKNLALYMPTYSPSNTPGSYKIVDGKYYQKMEVPPNGVTDAYMTPSTYTGVDYVEINFGTELEVVSIFLITTVETPNYDSSLKIKVYNQYRDIIATLNPLHTDFTNITVNLASPSLISPGGATKTIGVSILKKYSGFLVAAGQMSGSVITDTYAPPNLVVPGCDNTVLAAVRASGCASQPTSVPRFTRGSTYGGIPAQYLRVYNVSQYVQISQIMAYGGDGTNYALYKSATSASIFPGTYPAKATDGLGGYYHTARTCADSYRSSGKRYDFLEVDLGATQEIVGVRCIFPSDNQGQNFGTRIHLLDSNHVVLAQYVIGQNEFQEVLIDYRQQPQSIPITNVIMPKIYSLTGLNSLRSPNGVAEDANGNVYVADTLANKIWITSWGSATTTTGSATVFSSDASLSYPIGLALGRTNLYVACYGNNKIVKINLATRAVTTISSSVPKPYGICLYTDSATNVNTLYITSYQAAAQFYTITLRSDIVTTYTPQIPINFPTSIAYVTLPNRPDSLFVSSGVDKCIYMVDPTTFAVIKYIGTGTGVPVSVALSAPSAIFYDPKTSVLFVSDYAQDTVYSVRLLTGATEDLAGTGKGGFSGDGLQGSLANLDGPMNLFYSYVTGFLYVSDYNNKKVRYLNLYSKPPATIASTTTTPQWDSWTTTTLGQIPVSSISTFSGYVAPTVTPSTFQQITSPPKISNATTVAGITAFYTIDSTTTYYCKTDGKLYIKGVTPTIIASGFGTNITCITKNGGYLYLCDLTSKCIWKLLAAAPYTVIKNSGGTAIPLITTDGIVNGPVAGQTYYAHVPNNKPSGIGLQGPTWIGFDNKGRLYISDTVAHCIFRMNSFGNGLEVYVGNYNQQGSSAITVFTSYGMNVLIASPNSFVFDSQNNLIFVDFIQEIVYKVLNENGLIQPLCNFAGSVQYADTVRTEGTFPLAAPNYKIRNPFGIAIDTTDALYVTSYNGQQILKMTYSVYTTSYTIDVVAGFGSYVENLSSFTEGDVIAKYASLNNPSQIMYTTSGIFFLDSSTNTIRTISPQTVSSLPITSVLPYGPLNIVANYSQNTFNTTIDQYSGQVDEKFALMENFNANSVCVDTTGNTYFPNTKMGTILKMDSSGNISILSSGPLSPVVNGIANYKDIYLWVTDGTRATPISLPGGTPGTSISVPGCSNVAVSPIGLLYVAAPSGTNQKIYIYNLKKGNVLQQTITVVSTYTNSINSLCADPDGNLYVGITGALNECRILKYDASSALVGTTVNLGKAVNGIAYSGGSLYYSCGTAIYKTGISTTTQITTITSGTTAQTISRGTAIIGQATIQGQASDGSYSNTTTLYGPKGLCIDLNGVIYIVDQSANDPTSTVLLRNSVYTPLQPSLLYTIAGTNGTGTTQSPLTAYMETFNSIQGCCYDSIGRMYISDAGLNTISMIDLTGTLTTFAGHISTAGYYTGDSGYPSIATLNRPTDIKMSKSDVMYIADTGNNAIRRVKIYSMDSTAAYDIETYISSITSPSALAIDSYENVYVVTNGTTISVISPMTEALSTIYTAASPVYALAVDSMDRLYYASNGAVTRIGTPSYQITGLNMPIGLAIDASNTIYISDAGNNRVYSTIAGNSTPMPIIGDGTAPTVNFSNTSGVAQNIYGNGTPPMTQAFAAPGALAVNSARGLLITQPTKASLLPFQSAASIVACGATTVTTITIKNRFSPGRPMYLSQIVALDTTGTNVLLKYDTSPHFDGFYGSKTAGATSIDGGETLTITFPATNIAIVLLYIGSNNRYYWNSAIVTVGSQSPRYIWGIVSSGSLVLPQYICLDYRNRTPLCTPFINYVNKYKIQSLATTESYRLQYPRYIRIAAPSSAIVLSQVYILHGETGQNLCGGKIPNVAPSMQPLLYVNNANLLTSFSLLTNGTNSLTNTVNFPNISNTLPTGAIQADVWIEYDLGDEVPVEQIILQRPATRTETYTVTAYTSNRTLVAYPSGYNTLDNAVKYVRIQGGQIGGDTITGVAGLPTPTSGITSKYTEYAMPTLTTIDTDTSLTITSISGIMIPPHMIIVYNQAREEIARRGLTYSPYNFQIPKNQNLAYSLAPIIGTRRVRYIRVAGISSTVLTINQILAFDSNCINVSYGKSATASTNSGTANLAVNGVGTSPFIGTDISRWAFARIITYAYWELDLGQEYELIQLVYIGTGITAEISLLDAFRVIQNIYSISQTETYKSYDLRSDYVKHFVALPAPYTGPATSLYVPDTGLQGFLRGRYVRIENNIPGVALAISVPPIYDIYGKNLVNGKVITQPATPTDYGAAWEIDLGQEYSIRNIITPDDPVTYPIAIYNRLRAEIWRNYISLYNISAPFPLQILPATATGTPLRFIRVVSATPCTINHIAAIDTRGLDVAVWKPVRTVSGSTVAYNTFNGVYNSAIPVTDRLEIDLGQMYNIQTITVYTSGTPTVTVYNANGNIISFSAVTSVLLPSRSGDYTGYGIKTRYVGLTTLVSNANVYNVAVIDSLGRNLAWKFRTNSSGYSIQFTNYYNNTTAYQLSTNYTEIDLGEEHFVRSVIVYSNYTGTPTLTNLPTPDTALNGTTVKLMDAYYNNMPSASQTLQAASLGYNISYPIGSGTPYYASPPTGVSVVPNTANAIWSFPITETNIATSASNLPASIVGMAVALDETIYFTRGDANIYKISANTGTYSVLSTVQGSIIQAAINSANTGAIIALDNATGVPSSAASAAIYQSRKPTLQPVFLSGIVITKDDSTLYLCDSSNGMILKYIISSNEFSVIAGGAIKDNTDLGHQVLCVLNGAASFSSFNNPTGIAISPDNTKLYVADTGNHLIRVIAIDDPRTYFVSTLAGATTFTPFPHAGSYNGVSFGGTINIISANGPNNAYSSFPSSVFSSPYAITVDSLTGNIYVADSDVMTISYKLQSPSDFVPSENFGVSIGNFYTIRCITPDGTVSLVDYFSDIKFSSLAFDSTNNILYGSTFIGKLYKSINTTILSGYSLIDGPTSSLHNFYYHSLTSSSQGSAVLMGTIGTSNDGYITASSPSTAQPLVASTPSSASSTSTLANWKWPGVPANSAIHNMAEIITNSSAVLGNITVITCRQGAIDLGYVKLPTGLTTNILYVYEPSKIRRIWSSTTRLGYCQATLAGTAPANTFLLSRNFTYTSPNNSVIVINGTYSVTTNPLIYTSTTPAATTLMDGVENKYYSMPNLPLIGPNNGTTALPIVDPTGTSFIGATFAEVLDFSQPGLPAFTISSITNTSFLVNVTSFGSDYATSYTCSLNGTMTGMRFRSSTATITASPYGSSNTFILYGENANGSTPSAPQQIVLAPGPFTVSYLITSSAQINISSTQSVGASGYQYTWSDTIGNSPTTVNYDSTTFSTTISPNPGSTCTFSIVSYNSSPTNTSAPTITFGVPSPQVNNIFIYTWSATSMEARWSVSTNATSYTCTIATAAAPQTILSTVTALTTSAIFVNITPYTTSYIIGIVANNSTGAVLPAVTYTTTAPTTPVIQNITYSGGKYIVQWIGGELTTTTTTGITYQTSTTGPSSGFATVTVTSPSARTIYTKTGTIVGGAAGGNTVYVRVQATYNTTTVSSAPYTLVTIPTPVVINAAYTSTATTFSISWTGGVGATSYSYKIGSNIVTATTDNGVASNSATFTTIPGSSVTVYVAAISSSGFMTSYVYKAIYLVAAVPTILSFTPYPSYFTIFWDNTYTPLTSYSITFTNNGNPITPVAATPTTANFTSSPGTTYTIVMNVKNKSDPTATVVSSSPFTVVI